MCHTTKSCVLTGLCIWWCFRASLLGNISYWCNPTGVVHLYWCYRAVRCCLASKTKKQKSAAALKKDATPEVICPICDESIVDSSIKNAGHDSIFCEGACKAWLHRRCAGLVKIAFEEVSKSKDNFFCPHCKLVNHESEILSLRASLSSLSNELSSIKTLVASLSSRDNQPPIQNKPEAPAIISDDNAPQLRLILFLTNYPTNLVKYHLSPYKIYTA